MNDPGGALLLTALAGSATLVGGLVGLTPLARDRRFVATCLAFAAGAMVYISFVEILPAAQAALAEVRSPAAAGWWTLGALFLGMGIAFALDAALPVHDELHHAEAHDDVDRARLRRLGLVTALALALHNIPEGVAPFVAAQSGEDTGLRMAFAIGLHNVPEGVAVAVPLYHATNSAWAALGMTALAGVAEPVGALLAWGLVPGLAEPATFGPLFAVVAGIMVYIALDELWPEAHRRGPHPLPIVGLVAGMALMGGSLLLL